VAAAAALLDREAIDVGLLDVNLGGEMVFPIARALADRGVPFIFLTGYDEESLPAAWRDRPLLEKPVTPSILGEALAGVA
jgi:DNA-binding response OmpR family regulator